MHPSVSVSAPLPAPLPAPLLVPSRAASAPKPASKAWQPLIFATGALLGGPLWSADPGAAGPAAPAKAAPAVAGKAAQKGHDKGHDKGHEKGHDKGRERPATAALAIPVAPGAAPQGSDDPMERLRQRLGEKLTTAKPAAGGLGPLEVQVLGKAPAVPQAHAGKKGHGAKGGGHAKAHETHAAHWAYTGPAGPQTWGGLKPEFSLCAKGQRQSPIDIQGGLPVDLEPVQFHYKASRFAVVDNGHTVQANLAGGNFIEVGGKRFELKQFHFHRPSEERIDGRQFDMSLHLVHKDDQGRLAVVGLLLDRGAAHPAVQKVWNNLPLEKQEEQPARVLLELNDLLPSSQSYYTYMGSLTTPPCSEGVQWIVMRQPVSVSLEQIELFARLYPMNARPIQQVAGRRILQTP